MVWLTSWCHTVVWSANSLPQMLRSFAPQTSAALRPGVGHVMKVRTFCLASTGIPLEGVVRLAINVEIAESTTCTYATRLANCSSVICDVWHLQSVYGVSQSPTVKLY